MNFEVVENPNPKGEMDKYLLIMKFIIAEERGDEVVDQEKAMIKTITYKTLPVRRKGQYGPIETSSKDLSQREEREPPWRSNKITD